MSSDSDGGESASSCAALVKYQNRTYLGRANVKVTVGEKLGTATEPPCDDTPNDGQDEPATPASRTAYAVEGVDPGIAIWVEGSSDDVLFIAADSGKKLPPEVEKLIVGS
ncbi:DUF6281 family protein [Streptomyces laculatispora]|uniref:DUF6281 family protein n=1 Tax=Streptomyces laculatispora TaxID=887464 RepID=UPI001A949A3F|nr:DUF6281 family protein [Streptomyces laculatispora]MBO0917433.1 hypothetical protein [Streptomyces laculatispora]